MEEHISLNKYVSNSGFCSRREADKLIEQGRVTINDKVARMGDRVKQGDKVDVDGEAIKSSSKIRPIYIAMNKPMGISSTTDPKDKTNIITYLDYPKRIFPIGRLDKDSDGLIFLTNDGDIVNKVLRAGNEHEKEYMVIVNKPITTDFIQAMGNGVEILGTTTKECFVKQEGNKRFRIILTQGLNRQIRRMCEALGYTVVKLSRQRVMNIRLGDLPPGKWRYFTTQEVDMITKMVASSSKTEEASHEPKKRKVNARKQVLDQEAEIVEQYNQDIGKKITPHKKGAPARSYNKPSPKATDKKTGYRKDATSTKEAARKTTPGKRTSEFSPKQIEKKESFKRQAFKKELPAKKGAPRKTTKAAAGKAKTATRKPKSGADDQKRGGKKTTFKDYRNKKK